MSRSSFRIAVGLVLAVVLAWGMSLDTRAAATAVAKATATAVTGGATPVAGTPAGAPEPIPSKSLAGVFMTDTVAADAAQGQGQAKPRPGKPTQEEVYAKFQKVTPAQQKAAAERAAALGMMPGAAGLDLAAASVTPADLGPLEGPGGVPHYFGPYGNWAYSPLPSFPVLLSVTVDEGGSGYNAPVVTIKDVYGTGTASDDSPLVGTATVVDGVITVITVPEGGKGFHVPLVEIVDSGCGLEGLPVCGTGAAATAVLDLATPDADSGLQKFVDSLPGVPGVTTFTDAGRTGQANNLGQYIPVAQKEEWCNRPEAAAWAEQTQTTCVPADYYEIAVVEYEEQMHSNLPPTRLRGYVQLSTPTVPGARIGLTNPDGTTVTMPNGSQAVAVDRPHYLGPIIVAQGRVHGLEAINPEAGSPRAVRVKYYNLLPTGTGGDLFLPVDETVPGSGYGPSVLGEPTAKYKQNRMTPHLHGNNTVWLSDGNTHQWITPATQATPYPAGTSARNVPDMTGCSTETDPLLPGRSGCMTFYYTNAQSARLQFYHDHAHGITRLNVYAGMAAGYVVTDAVEQDLIAGTNVTGIRGIDALGNPIPGTYSKVLPDLGIPLIIQDKTFVDETTIFAQDPTWNWGTTPKTAEGKITAAKTGDLWMPHVYMTVQNPWDLTGTNGFGKWHYGPWFNPPTPECVNGGPIGCIETGPVPNEYYQPICETDPNSPDCTAPWEPPMRPGVPNPSIPGEAFMDTPLVNGTAYPYVTVPAGPVRFRILNAANDRFFNLQLYVAADKTTPTLPGTTGTALCGAASTVPVENCTEVKMIPVGDDPNQLAENTAGIPDPGAAGPPWILIGTEGGFMPKPIIVPQQPIGWNFDMGYFAFGIVNQHSLYLGSAERADVLVDFSGKAGQTFILYNDSPAPVPAGAAPFDFYTGDGDQVDGGAAPNTQPGYGPNTRTIMQIRVGAAPAAPVDLAQLDAVWAKNSGNKRGVFEVSQDPIIIPQEAYGSAYDNTRFPKNASQYILNVQDTQKTFTPIGADGSFQTTGAVTIPLEQKAMHDEMGGVYDTMFGRMSGMLGLTNPNSPVHVLIPYGYSSPPTDIVKGSLEASPIGSLADGTQIWRIFHNGVDTHPIHTHLFHAQVINRVDQSGQVTAGTLPVDEMDLGWKDTVKINPLEITYLALRPTVPTPDQVPFEVPNSIRLIDPGLPEGANLIPPAPAGWFDPQGNPLQDLRNHYVNFGWEYVWHCHILSHEEMDFMHALAFAVPPLAPTNFTAAATTTNNPVVLINWMDNSTQEEKFTIQRATNATFTSGLTSIDVIPPDPTTTDLVTYTDTSVARNTNYWYRVFANGPVVGDVGTPGFPLMSADAPATTATGSTVIAVSTAGTTIAAPTAPTNLAATLQSGPQVLLAWTDTARNETGFVVDRCTVTATNPCTDVTTGFVQIASPGPRNNTGSVTYTDTTVAFGNTYVYRVGAFNAGGTTYATGTATAGVAAPPIAPTNFLVTNLVRSGNRWNATLTWAWANPDPAASTPISFTIQRATNLGFTSGLTTRTVTPGTARTFAETGLARNAVYYYRIRANGAAGSSAWLNALPFPIRTQ